MTTDVLIGIDVGTGSARAGVFDAAGRMLGLATHDIRMGTPRTDFAEQSSADIWSAVCRTVRGALKQADDSYLHSKMLLLSLGLDILSGL